MKRTLNELSSILDSGKRTGKIFTNMYVQTFTTLPSTHPSLVAKRFNTK